MVGMAGTTFNVMVSVKISARSLNQLKLFGLGLFWSMVLDLGLWLLARILISLGFRPPSR